MFIAKDLLIKGMLGAGLCVGTGVAGICYREDIKRLVKSGVTDNKVGPTTDKDWIKAVGLSCGEEEINGNGVECTILDKPGTINIKLDDANKSEGKSKAASQPSPAGKIKVYKLSGESSGYKNDLKFAIEDGDIALDGSSKLEEFETYQIEEVTGEKGEKKYYLSRKEKAIDEKRRILGLPDACKLPETTDASGNTPTCEIELEKIKGINFDGKNGEPTITDSGKLQITITKLSSGDDFLYGHKFSLKTTAGTLTINRTDTSDPITIKNTESTDFKIKKNGKSLSLAKAWDLNTLTKKVGLTCASDTNICTQLSEPKTNIKQDGTDHENKALTTSNSAKIKVYKNASEYNKGFKFAIEGGDYTFNTSNKLEEFETYEIVEDSGKWYFSRKNKANESIEKALGLPSSCKLPTNGATGSNPTCTISKSEELKKIEFDGKNTNGATIDSSGTVSLTITKSTTSNSSIFSHGYKFSFKPNKDLKISDSISVKENTSTDFKIKKSGDNKLTLEKAWDLGKLIEKVGLEGCSNGNSECTIKDGSFNVKQDSDKLDGKTKSTNGSSGKIKVYKDDEGKGYENGFKFVIEEGDINLNNGSPNKKLEEFETYEITEVDSKWYLTRKEKAIDEKSRILGLPEGCKLPSSDSDSSACKDKEISDDQLKNIKFEGKKSDGSLTITGNGGNTKLTITKTNDTTTYTDGYKFVFSGEKDISIPKDSGSINIKKKTNTEFKIKKSGKTLTLEKAWSVAELGKKAGLKNCSGKECTLDSGKINVHDGGSNKVECAKVKNNNGSEKKIKYEEDQEGYNQGIKFYVEGNDDINLTCNGNDDSNVKIEKQGDSTPKASYEIKEVSGTWYLYKKSSSAGE